ncbi:hypothetical protein BH18ACI5_BH18ACI5_04030 [soil metagenome]
MKSTGEASSTFSRSVQVLDRAKQVVAFGDQLDVHVDRAVAPAVKHRRRAAGEIYAAALTRPPPELPQESLDPVQVRGVTHSAARSKLTRRLMRALYLE